MTKQTKTILFYGTTGFLVLFEGVLVLFTSQTELAKEGIRHLGFPLYFGVELAVFKVLGALVIALPKVSFRLKELAYFGFFIVAVSAAVGHMVVDGFEGQTLFALVILLTVVTSWYSSPKRV